jgi:hypothetical protein
MNYNVLFGAVASVAFVMYLMRRRARLSTEAKACPGCDNPEGCEINKGRPAQQAF